MFRSKFISSNSHTPLNIALRRGLYNDPEPKKHLLTLYIQYLSTDQDYTLINQYFDIVLS